MQGVIDPIARAGYAARGVAYLIIGFFAALAAMGRSDAKGTRDILATLLSSSFGATLVVLLTLGFFAIFVWRLIQAVTDRDNHGAGAKGIFARAGLLLAGISYAGLGAVAVGLLIGSRLGEGGDDPSDRWLSAIHEWGLQGLLVYSVAATMTGVGIAHIVRGVRASFEKYMSPPAQVMRWLRPLSQTGLIARGVVFLILAALILRGGLAYDIADQPGLADALRAVQDYPFGWLLLMVIAVGLAAFGIYSLAEARYRRVKLS